MMNYQQFAEQIRRKYPGSYDKVDDKELAEAVIKKYPAYEGKVDMTEVSKTESAFRGLSQGLTMGWSDEGNAIRRALWERMTGGGSVMDKGVGDAYRRNVDAIRAANLKAQEMNPKTYGAGQVTGAVAPVVAATMAAGPGGGGAAATRMGLGRTAATLGAVGGIEGAGYSTGETPGEVAKDVAMGAGMGAAFPVALRGAGKTVQGLGRMMKATPKHLASAATGVKPSALEMKWAKPGAVSTAKTMPGLAERMPRDIKLLDRQIGKLDEAAKATLKTTPATTSKEITTFINDLASKQGVGQVQANAAKNLTKFGQMIKTKFKNKPINEVELKQLIKDADANINWADPASKLQNNLFKSTRKFMDTKLKTMNPEYAEKMKPVAVYQQLKDDAIDYLGLEKKVGGGYTATDRTVSRLRQLPKERGIEGPELAKRAKELTGRDIMEKARLSAAREGFEGGRLGLPMLRFTGEGAGGYVAEKGVEVAKTLDKILKVPADMLPTAVRQFPQLFGQYAPILQKSLERGTQNLAVTHYTLQQMDPEYRKQLEIIRERTR